MNETPPPKLSKFPFILADVLLLGFAAWVVFTVRPLEGWQVVAVVAAAGLAAWIGVLPFILQFRADTRHLEVAQLGEAMQQFGDLQGLARQISSASSEWQQIHQATTKIVAAADQVSEKITSETRQFSEVVSNLNETEKNHLRLEIEKLRRGEGESLQTIVRLLDHVYALHHAALRSGQKNIIEQLTQFQASCRDTVRRLGLAPLIPKPATPFNASHHQLMKGQTAAENALVGDVLAPGYTYQGQVIRLPLVTLAEAQPAAAAEEPNPAQEQLPLDAPQ